MPLSESAPGSSELVKSYRRGNQIMIKASEEQKCLRWNSDSPSSVRCGLLETKKPLCS